MGDYGYTASELDEIGQTDGSLERPWIAGDWTTVDETTNGSFADTARSGLALPDADRAASLGISKALVGDSETTRETLRALLEATQISPDG